MKNALFIVLGLALTTPLAAGCSGATMSDGSVATANEAETKAPVARGAHGPVKFLGEALGEVPLSPAQRTEIERLAAEAELRHAPVAAARRDVVETLATQIEAGHLDRAALEAKIDAVAAAAEGTRAADRAALERLHFVLDDEQRSELVDAIEDKIHEGWHGRGGPHAHMQEWRAALKLTDDQVSRIHEALRVQFEAHRGDAGAHFRDGMRKGKRALEAFKEDRFVLDEVAPAEDLRARSRAMGGAMISVVEAVLPILTPEQRALAAQKLRSEGEPPMMMP